MHAPSFDLNQSIKVVLDSVGLISVNKVYMSSPTMLDPTISMALKINAQEKIIEPKTDSILLMSCVSADTNVLFKIFRTGVGDVNNLAQKTQAWCLLLKYILEGFTSIPLDMPDLAKGIIRY